MRGTQKKRARRASALLTATAFGIALLLVTRLPGETSHAGPVVSQESAVDIAPQNAEEEVQSDSVTIHLPLVFLNYPPPPTTFGTFMFRITPARKMQLAVDGGLQWVSFSAFSWDEIQPEPDGPYHWETVDEFSLTNAASIGLEVIAVIQYAPAWAQAEPGYACGPISPEALPAFSEFLTALVTRYSAAPYHIRYWQLGNEPDVDPALVPEPRSSFGCWGDEDDPYYGGGYYAEMLKAAYPAIKAADPWAQVVLGGLLLYCDPTAGLEGGPYQLPANLGGGPLQSCHPSLFLEGILRNEGGDYLDFVSFHGYPPYDGTLQQDKLYLNWDVRGGIVLGKLDFLREVMANYGVDKPVMHTEGALLCSVDAICTPPSEDFYEAQADYVVWMFVRNIAEGLPASIWYGWEGPGWKYSSLLDGNQDPRPAYYALDFLAEEIEGKAYMGAVNVHPNLLGFEFFGGGEVVWILWPPDEQAYDITLPGNALAVYDKYGTDITPPGGILTVDHPLYVELAP